MSLLDLATGAITPIHQGREVITDVSLNASRTRLGFTLQAHHLAPEAYVSATDPFCPVPVSRVNAHLAGLPHGRLEVIRWKSFDGTEIEGLLQYPIDYQPGQRVPLLLWLHGGPALAWSPYYAGIPWCLPEAVLSARGYALLMPNFRGSAGYGREFRFANDADWGGGDYQEVMTGVDHVVAMGVAHPDRLGVMGWSYGGSLAAWTITQTRRFRVASIGQGYEFYRALKQRGVPVRMQVLPRQPHGPTEPKMLLAAMRANLEWFGRYL